MSRPGLAALRNDLLAAGIAPKHVLRVIVELDEHFDDLVVEAMAAKLDRCAAEQKALSQLGDLEQVAMAMRQQPQLRGWAWRWPRVAAVIYPLAYVAALPAVPLVFGIQHAASIGRWLAGLLLAGFVTAFMFLLLQLSILLA